MKTTLMLITCLIMAFQTCSNQNIGTPQGEELEWVVGTDFDGSDHLSSTHEVESLGSSVFNFDLLSDSLCPNLGVKVTVSTLGVNLKVQEIFNFPYDFSAIVPQDQTITIRTEIINNPDSDIICVWSGNATCVLTY